ncbi:MAG: hypothetical protein DRR16_17300 [Candidatus Parabeggiatoa sp. nov. 3]|nr:MAG: hypothetical protein DRR00_14890 [Gammaproteobacteria bacterium]RKZ68659.1 MAG: hypothetical protein DRQ99_03105 [Gammaproteobacteria bacterium]RKZ83418.1 MAG: hypothetical protein DRR16_17300 [Gammaproteobacteria bacterium]
MCFIDILKGHFVMPVYQIQIKNKNVENRMMSVTLLQALLSVLIEGSKGALRLRTEGRSMMRGAPPQWIKTATQFSIAFQENQLEVESLPLLEVVPELFEKSGLFPELNPEWTSLDYFQESLTSAILTLKLSQHHKMGNSRMVDSIYDSPLLYAFQRFRYVFNQGAALIHFVNGKGLQITPESVTAFKELEANLPPPTKVKVAGKLQAIRMSDRTFRLSTAQHQQVIKGIVKPLIQKAAQALLSKDVLVSGLAYFTSNGKILRIEADHVLMAGEDELASYGKLPSFLSVLEPKKPDPKPLIKEVPQEPQIIQTQVKTTPQTSGNNDEMVQWRERFS